MGFMQPYGAQGLAAIGLVLTGLNLNPFKPIVGSVKMPTENSDPTALDLTQTSAISCAEVPQTGDAILSANAYTVP